MEAQLSIRQIVTDATLRAELNADPLESVICRHRQFAAVTVEPTQFDSSTLGITRARVAVLHSWERVPGPRFCTLLTIFNVKKRDCCAVATPCGRTH